MIFRVFSGFPEEKDIYSSIRSILGLNGTAMPSNVEMSVQTERGILLNRNMVKQVKYLRRPGDEEIANMYDVVS